MTTYFVDTSALVKRYASDGSIAEAQWVSSLVDSAESIFVSAITEIESVAVLARKGNASPKARRRAQRAIAQFDQDFKGSFRIVDCDVEVLRIARRLAESGLLFGSDAIQLASAIQVNMDLLQIATSGLVFVSAHKALNVVAVSEGLNIDDPANHQNV